MTRLTQFAGFALAGLLILASPAAARPGTPRSDDEQKETERVQRTVQIRAGGELRLKNFSGRITIAGSSRGDMSLLAVRRASRDRLDHIKLEIVETSSGVTVEANKKDPDWRERDNNVVDTEFTIEVPADISVDIDAFSSDVDIKDVRGRQRVHTFSGDISLTGGDKVIDAETFSGDISVKIAQGASASVEFNSFSGELNAEVPVSYRSSGRRNRRVDIGSGGPDYRFKTFSGNVRIR
jgi:hypothetical protein